MSNDHKLHFDDLEEGARFELGSVSLTKAEIIDFARQFDPQAFHLDEEAGKAVFGGLAASGWHTASLYQRLLVDTFLERVMCLGGAGIERLQFVRPVFADDRLSGFVTIANKRLSKSKPDRGLIKLQCEMRNGDDELVLTLEALVMIGAR